MARVGRLAGAILVETGGTFFLVGNTKEPCGFAAAGFESPAEIDALKRPFIKLSPCRAVQISSPYLTMDIEGEELAKVLAERFLIERNGSVSDRLWSLVMSEGGEADAQWLVEMPEEIWQIVRGVVLKCT